MFTHRLSTTKMPALSTSGMIREPFLPTAIVTYDCMSPGDVVPRLVPLKF